MNIWFCIHLLIIIKVTKSHLCFLICCIVTNDLTSTSKRQIIVQNAAGNRAVSLPQLTANSLIPIFFIVIPDR